MHARCFWQERRQHSNLLSSLVWSVLTEHFPEADRTNWEACEWLVPHIQASATQLDQRGQQSTAQVEAAALFGQAGRYLRDRARYAEAESLLERALAICEQQFGLSIPRLQAA